MISEHLKAFLAFKQTYDTHQHGKWDTQLKQMLKNFTFQGIRRITYDVITFRRINSEEILTVENMGCNHGVATLPEELYK